MRKVVLYISDRYQALSITACGLDTGGFAAVANLTTYVCNLNDGEEITIDENGHGSQKKVKEDDHGGMAQESNRGD